MIANHMIENYGEIILPWICQVKFPNHFGNSSG